jgi:PAS domain S-box-containing protein
VAVLGGGVLISPQHSGPLWATIGALSVGAILLGVRRHAPLRSAPWLLLAAAVSSMAAGDTIYGANSGTAPAAAEFFYLAMFPLITAGLLVMTRASMMLADRSRLLDLMTFACAATLATWVTLIGPMLSSPSMESAARTIIVAYALGDLLILVAAVHLLVAARRSWSVLLLAGGAAALLAADLWYAQAQIGGGGWQPGGPAELGYLLFYAAWGAAALHPSMRTLTEPVEAVPARRPGRSTTLLTLSLLVPAVLLLVQVGTGEVRDLALIVAVSLVMLCLVMTRLTDAIGHYWRSMLRERTLRAACGALVGATDADDVRAAARTAVGDLLPPGQPYEVVVVVDDSRFPAVAADRRTRLIDTGLLDPDLPDTVRRLEAALICPLSVAGRSRAGGACAAMVVAASRAALMTTRNTIEVLAAQAALALERVSLTEAMNRRDSDEYLRTVVQKANDVVLVVDEDERIRYASPSLTAVLGVQPPLRTTLPELVDPADREQITRTVELARKTRNPDGVRDVWVIGRPDGNRVTVEVTYRDLRGDRMVRGFVVTMHDVTERQRADLEPLRRALQASPAGRNRQSSARKFE